MTKLLSDEELARQIEIITQTMFVTLSEWQAGVTIDWYSAKVKGRQELFDLFNSQKHLYAESVKNEFANDVKGNMIGKLSILEFAQLRETLRTESED